MRAYFLILIFSESSNPQVEKNIFYLSGILIFLIIEISHKAKKAQMILEHLYEK